MLTDSKQFTWTKGVGVAKASDFGHGFKLPKEFRVKSSKTGRTVLFQFAKEIRNGEETQAWEYLPRDRSGIKLVILND